MMICKNSDCIKKDNCKRFLNDNSSVANYKAICGVGLSKRDYEWFCEDDTKLPVNMEEVKDEP